MTNTYLDKSYAYAVARLRHEELKLLNKSFMDQLISAKTAEDAARQLRDRGWGSSEDNLSFEDMISAENDKIWSYVEELVPDLNVFNVFRYVDDYSNIKAAIKESKLEHDYPGIYSDRGTVSPETVKAAIRGRNYSLLPAEMAEAAEKAHDVFLKTGDGQLCDILTDRACLDAIREAGKASGDRFIEEYAELSVAAADIKIAVRAHHTGNGREFLEMALADSDILSVSALINASLAGDDAIASFLAYTDFADGTEALKTSNQAFERWCDNMINDRMQSMHYESFGAGPIAAYIIARFNEIKSVGVILFGKQNGFSEQTVKERVRDTYV